MSQNSQKAKSFSRQFIVTGYRPAEDASKTAETSVGMRLVGPSTELLACRSGVDVISISFDWLPSRHPNFLARATDMINYSWKMIGVEYSDCGGIAAHQNWPSGAS